MCDVNKNELPAFVEYLGHIEDPRLDRQKSHKLIDIIAMAVCATIAGADGWVAIAQYARSKQEWLRSFVELPNGIPSHDTVGRVFSLLDPKSFQDAFRHWVGIIQGKIEGVVAIDG